MPLHAVGPNCPGIAAQNPGLAKYITAAIGFPFVLLLILVSVIVCYEGFLPRTFTIPTKNVPTAADNFPTAAASHPG